MNIQIFGRAKCFESKKAMRYFKERRIPFQYIDLGKKAMSRGELKSVAQALGGLDALVDESHPDAALLRYLAYEGDRLEKLAEEPDFLRAPIVRNGKAATLGFQPEQWAAWK